MNILFIGDIIGKPGRKILREQIYRIMSKHQVDFCIANAENSAAGFGVTQKLIHQLLDLDIDCLTSGNHIWDKKEIVDQIDSESRLLRPANYPAITPGRYYGIYESNIGHKVGVLNLAGRVFMPCIDCPFQVAKKVIAKIKEKTPIIIVDFHAEATSEKIAMGWYLDGMVTAVIGTHTHVQTADARVLPKGTAYITDVGMTGPFDSVIGIKKEVVIERFLTQMPQKFVVASNDLCLNAVLIDCNPGTGMAKNIERLQVPMSLIDDDRQGF